MQASAIVENSGEYNLQNISNTQPNESSGRYPSYSYVDKHAQGSSLDSRNLAQYLGQQPACGEDGGPVSIRANEQNEVLPGSSIYVSRDDDR